MLKAQIDESFNSVNHADITAVFSKQPKPLITATLVEEKVEKKFLAEKPLVSCLDDIEVFLVPAYYQTDD
jgi:hypothetical protein